MTNPPQARPRVVIDGYNLSLDKGTGVATYARNLSYALRENGLDVGILFGKHSSASRDLLAREVSFFDPRPPKQPNWLQDVFRTLRQSRRAAGMTAFPVPLSGAVILQGQPYFNDLWNIRDLFGMANVRFDLFGSFMPARLPGPAPDLMHWTYPFPVRLQGTRNIYTLHDMVPLRLPQTTLDNKRRYLRVCRRIVRDAAHIVTVSEWSRQDIIRLLGVPEDRVTCTYQSVHVPQELANRPLDQVSAELTGSYGLDFKGYHLFFGAIEPKKNVGRLIDAYLASGIDRPLVIVGKRAWKADPEMARLTDEHIRYLLTEGPRTVTRRRIHHIDYAPFPMLVNLIRGARSVMFPSLYEGFGLPAMEAMLLGTPVLTSNTSSLPEVVGDAAICVDPYNMAEMVQAIRKIDSDTELCERLASAGPRQAAQFGVEQYAGRLRALYGRLGVGDPSRL